MRAVGRIGVMIPSIRYHLDTDFLDGIHSTAKALGYDTVVFTNASNAESDFWQNDYLDGENNIFRLAEQCKLDGIILAASKFANPESALSLCRSVQKLQIPCIVTEFETDGRPSVYAPQKEAICRMTEHLIQEHYCKNIYCLTGPKAIIQSQPRLDGYREAMENAGLPVTESQVFYGDFWTQAAKELGERIASGEIPMPDAIVCASDMMALSLCETLQAHRIKIPEQIAVTGYDGNIRARTHNPPIATVSGMERMLGEQAAAALYHIKTGKESTVPQNDFSFWYGESCGCAADRTDAIMEGNRMQLSQHEESDLQELYLTSNYIIKMAECASLDEFAKAVDSLLHLLPNWRWLDICLCTDWMRDFSEPDSYRQSGYSDEMLLLLSNRFAADNPRSGYTFPVRELIPDLKKAHEPQFLIVTPLHYIRQVFGYMVSAYDHADRFLMRYHYNNWCDAFSNGLRAMQEKLYIEQMQARIHAYAIRDQITGLYNQAGFSEYGARFFSENTVPDNAAMLLFISYQNIQISSAFSETDVSLTIANAIRLSCQIGDLAGHLNTRTFAVMMTLNVQQPLTEQADRWMVRFENLLKTIQKESGAFQFPQFVTDCSIVHATQATMIDQVIRERLHILSESLHAAEHSAGDFTEQLNQIQREIRLSPQKPWNIPDIAAEIGISVSYFQRLYTKQFGRSCAAEVISARLRKAKQLLETTTLRISEIAELCGYQDASNFMRMFRSKVGMTALEYRKEHQNRS